MSMSKLHFNIPTVLCLAFFSFVSCSQTEENPLSGSRPNIIFILADDLGWADLPVYGNPFNEAPNITQMAEQGIRFTDAYAACPVCSPTRASIMSGQYPARVGIIDFITGHWRPYEEVTVPINRSQHLPLEVYTLGEAMQDAGYHTGYFGKWHLGGGEFLPQYQGFDCSNVYQGGGFFDYAGRMSTPMELEPGKVLSEMLTDLSIDFIEEQAENPFFLFLAHFDVHVQLDADTTLIQKYLEKEKAENYPCNAVYAAMVEHVDNSVGRILQKVEELGLADHTMVVFFSDNGGLISRFDEVPLIHQSKQHIYEGDPLLYVASSNAPLRAEKGTLYEGGIREPMIVWWPGSISRGEVNNAIVSSVDLLPTFADLAGVQLPDEQVFDGISLVDILEGELPDPDRDIYWHYPVYHHEVPASAIRKGKWKLVHNLVEDTRALYNLEEDIGETKDLADVHPDVVSELSALLQSWRTECNARLPVPNPDFDPARRHEWGRHPDRQ